MKQKGNKKCYLKKNALLFLNLVFRLGENETHSSFPFLDDTYLLLTA